MTPPKDPAQLAAVPDTPLAPAAKPPAKSRKPAASKSAPDGPAGTLYVVQERVRVDLVRRQGSGEMHFSTAWVDLGEQRAANQRTAIIAQVGEEYPGAFRAVPKTSATVHPRLERRDLSWGDEDPGAALSSPAWEVGGGSEGVGVPGPVGQRPDEVVPHAGMGRVTVSPEELVGALRVTAPRTREDRLQEIAHGGDPDAAARAERELADVAEREEVEADYAREDVEESIERTVDPVEPEPVEPEPVLVEEVVPAFTGQLKGPLDPAGVPEDEDGWDVS